MIVLSKQTADRIKELVRLRSTELEQSPRNDSQFHGQFAFVQCLTEATEAGMYEGNVELLQASNGVWTTMVTPVFLQGANDEVLTAGTRYLALRTGYFSGNASSSVGMSASPSSDSRPLFVTACCGASTGSSSSA